MLRYPKMGCELGCFFGESFMGYSRVIECPPTPNSTTTVLVLVLTACNTELLRKKDQTTYTVYLKHRVPSLYSSFLFKQTHLHTTGIRDATLQAWTAE